MCVHYFLQLYKKPVYYKFILGKPAGPVFNLKYDGGIFFNVINSETDMFVQPDFELQSQVFVNEYTPPLPATVISVPFDESDLYTVQFSQDGSIHQFPLESLSSSDSTAVPTNFPPENPLWLKDNTPVTVLLPNMTTPKQGRLFCHLQKNGAFNQGSTQQQNLFPLKTLL